MAKVMIIDDEKDLVYLLKVVLEKEGFEVIESFNGKEAYEMLSGITQKEEAPDAILLDVMMPEMDGYTFRSKLQENEKLNDIPIIILTARGQMKDLFELSANVFAFLEKPFEPRNLVQIVKKATGSEK